MHWQKMGRYFGSCFHCSYVSIANYNCSSYFQRGKHWKCSNSLWILGIFLQKMTLCESILNQTSQYKFSLTFWAKPRRKSLEMTLTNENKYKCESKFVNNFTKCNLLVMRRQVVSYFILNSVIFVISVNP